MHGTARRFAARFALLAFALYHVPLLLNDYPSLGGGGFRHDGLAHAWGHVFTQVGVWVARHVFHLTGPMPDAFEGDNGDTAEEYCRLLVGVVASAVAATVWTLADRRAPRARWVEEALRVLLRYAIALGLASYGIAKILPQQFGQLRPDSLEMRLAELQPMGLLWRFMEASRPYSVFGGVMEMVAVLLLCFRRTARLGALVCVPVMSNVVMMNLCYDVPVKLFSTAMLVSAVALVFLDARPLLDVLVLHRAVSSAAPAPRFRSRRLNQVRQVVKLALVGGVILSSWYQMRGNVERAAVARASPLYGTWQVNSFLRDGRELAATAEPARWRRLTDSGAVVAESGSRTTRSSSAARRRMTRRARSP